MWRWMEHLDLGLRAWSWNHPVASVLLFAALLGVIALTNKGLDRWT